MKLTNFAVTLCILMGLSACENAPISKLVNPTLGNTTGTWGGPWVVYDDEIKTRGTVMMFTTKDGQTLDFSWRENPHQGSKCIKYSWNGGDVTSYETGATEHDFVGFSLIVADDVNKYNAVTKDLTPGGYTRISFWARGSLSSDVFLRLESNNGGPTTVSGTNAWLSNATDRKVTSSWQRYEFALSGSLASTKDFVKVILKFDPGVAGAARGNGGTIYLDDIRLEQ
jgi:hypothetical protein